MKAINAISVALTFLLLFNVQDLFGQCKGFVKQVDLSLLDKYDYCGDVMGAMMYSADSAEVVMKLEPRKKYRILVEAQEYLGKPQLEVTNKTDEIISLEIESEGICYWEIYTESKQKVTLKINFRARPKYNHGIDAAGCVVLAVGQIGLEELVENP